MPAATITLDALEKKGWYLNEEGVDSVKEQAGNDNLTLDQFIDVAKDIDLRELTDKGFRKGDLTKLSQLPATLVLQVLQIQNIAVPSIQHVEKPRLLRVVFTDGSKKKWIGAEILGQVESLNLNTPPGTKFLVTKPIEIREQLLILGPGMLTCLGGQVQEMIQAWKAGKQFIKRSKDKQTSSNEDTPPPFIPFKIKPNRSTKDDEPITKPPTSLKDDLPSGKGLGGDKSKSTKPNKKENKASSGRTPADATKKKKSKGNNKDVPTKEKKPSKDAQSDTKKLHAEKAHDDNKKPPAPSKEAKDSKKPPAPSKEAKDSKKSPPSKDTNDSKKPQSNKKPRDKKENNKRKTEPRQPPALKKDLVPTTPTVLSATSKPFVPSALSPPAPPQNPVRTASPSSSTTPRGRGGKRGRGGRGRGASQTQ